MSRDGQRAKRILYVEGCKDGTVGGSHSCLYNMVANIDRGKYYPIVIFYDDHVIAERHRALGIETRILAKHMPLDVGHLLKRSISQMEPLTPVLLPLQKAINLLWYFCRPVWIYARYLKEHQIDILHLNNSLNTNHDWMLAAKLAGVRVVSHERGISDKLSKTSKYFGKKLDVLVCVSQAIQEPLLRQGMSDSKTVVIYDGIDFGKIAAKREPDSIRAAYGIGKEEPIIGVVGNIKQWKGQETVVRATAFLKTVWPGIRCLLVGGTAAGDPYIKKLDYITEELGIRDNVIFTGFKKNPVDFMNVMDVVIHSSIEPEPFGMVNLEAMYMKKPVISTKIGGPLEIFKDGVDGILIDPGNPELLAAKVTELLSDPEMRAAIGQNAYDAVTRKFGIGDTVRKIQAIYEKVCPT